MQATVGGVESENDLQNNSVELSHFFPKKSNFLPNYFDENPPFFMKKVL